jgi:hypothetical protein
MELKRRKLRPLRLLKATELKARDFQSTVKDIQSTVESVWHHDQGPSGAGA